MLDQDVSKLPAAYTYRYFLIKKFVIDMMTQEKKVKFFVISIFWLSKCRRFFLYSAVNVNNPLTDPSKWGAEMFKANFYPKSTFLEWKLEQVLNFDDPSITFK